MSPKAPSHIAIILFPGFQLLDIAGPLDNLNILSHTTPLTLSILATTLDPVSTAIPSLQPPPLTTLTPALPPNPPTAFAQSILPTHTLATAPDTIDTIIVPGGLGTRVPANMAPIHAFLRARFEKLEYLLTVCTGSAVVAQTGLLDGRRATSNKKAFAWVRAQREAVEWVARARWVVDGKVWTSSGIAAGLDMVYAWVGEVWGHEVAAEVADGSEYERNEDAGRDRFAERWGAE